MSVPLLPSPSEAIPEDIASTICEYLPVEPCIRWALSSKFFMTQFGPKFLSHWTITHNFNMHEEDQVGINATIDTFDMLSQYGELKALKYLAVDVHESSERLPEILNYTNHVETLEIRAICPADGFEPVHFLLGFPHLRTLIWDGPFRLLEILIDFLNTQPVLERLVIKTASVRSIATTTKLFEALRQLSPRPNELQLRSIYPSDIDCPKGWCEGIKSVALPAQLYNLCFDWDPEFSGKIDRAFTLIRQNVHAPSGTIKFFEDTGKPFFLSLLASTCGRNPPNFASVATLLFEEILPSYLHPLDKLQLLYLVPVKLDSLRQDSSEWYEWFKAQIDKLFLEMGESDSPLHLLFLAELAPQSHMSSLLRRLCDSLSSDGSVNKLEALQKLYRKCQISVEDSRILNSLLLDSHDRDYFGCDQVDLVYLLDTMLKDDEFNETMIPEVLAKAQQPGGLKIVSGVLPKIVTPFNQQAILEGLIKQGSVNQAFLQALHPETVFSIIDDMPEVANSLIQTFGDDFIYQNVDALYLIFESLHALFNLARASSSFATNQAIPGRILRRNYKFGYNETLPFLLVAVGPSITAQAAWQPLVETSRAIDTTKLELIESAIRTQLGECTKFGNEEMKEFFTDLALSIGDGKETQSLIWSRSYGDCVFEFLCEKAPDVMFEIWSQVIEELFP